MPYDIFSSWESGSTTNETAVSKNTDIPEKKQKDPKRVAAGKKAAETKKRKKQAAVSLSSEQEGVDALLEIYDNAQTEYREKTPRRMNYDIAIKNIDKPLALGKSPVEIVKSSPVVPMASGDAAEDLRVKNLQPSPKPDYNKPIPTVQIPQKSLEKKFNEWTPSENVQNQFKQSVQAPEGGTTQGKIQPVTPQQAYGYAGNMAAPAGVLSPEEIQKQADEARKAAEEIAGGRNPHSENAIRELRQRDGGLSENKPAPSQVNNGTNSNTGSIVGGDKKTSNKAKWGKRAGYMGVGMAVLGAAGLAVNSLMINDKGRMNNAQMYGQQPYSQY